jgi:hypothetical protein
VWLWRQWETVSDHVVQEESAQPQSPAAETSTVWGKKRELKARADSTAGAGAHVVQ